MGRRQPVLRHVPAHARRHRVGSRGASPFLFTQRQPATRLFFGLQFGWPEGGGELVLGQRWLEDAWGWLGRPIHLPSAFGGGRRAALGLAASGIEDSGLSLPSARSSNLVLPSRPLPAARDDPPRVLTSCTRRIRRRFGLLQKVEVDFDNTETAQIPAVCTSLLSALTLDRKIECVPAPLSGLCCSGRRSLA